MKYLALLAAFAVMTVSAEPQKAIRSEFTSQPEGAAVIVDGMMRGTTPITLFDLAPGSHRVRFEKLGHEPVDDFFAVEEGGYVQKNAVLVMQKGLLLLTSEPAGCDISIDGMSLGETPRLVTTLNAWGTHRLLLQKPGYQPRTVEVKFNGRIPLVKHEKLIVDSGIVNVTSEPSGTDVLVNGQPRGKTPLTVTGIPKGRATITLKRGGFKETSREISVVAGEEQTLFLKMEGLPGTISLNSIPEGARFYVNDKPQGKGPITMRDLEPGTYNIRAELEGYGTFTRTVQLENGGSAIEEFKLENVMGRIEVRTKPAGVQVLIDGRNLGATKGKDEAATSDVFSIENVMEGEHVITLRKQGYADTVLHPVVENKKTQKLNAKLKRQFVPDIEVVTASGSRKGVLIKKTAMGIELEVKEGITQTIPSSEVRKIIFLK